VKGLLERMGYDHSKGVVSVPAYRIDVLHEVDLIEDIAIAYGYNNLEPEIPEVSTIGEIDQNVVLKSNIAEILVGLNMLETSSYHLTTKEHQIKKMGLKKSDFIEVLDSKTKYTILRKDLTHYLLKILGENVDVEYPQEIFQIGTVFDGLDEKENLAIALAPGNFTKLKQVFEYLGKMLGVKFEIVEPDEIPGHFIEGRVGEVLFEGKKIGYFGEVHPRLLRNFKIKMPVALGEICLDGVLKELS